MSASDWLKVAAVLALLFVSMGTLGRLSRRFGFSPELSRKSVHVVLGCVCMGLPWLFTDPLHVWILAGCATAPLAVLRRTPALRHSVGTVLHGVERISYGDICFMPAVATVFHLSGGDRLLHVIPIAILTLADAAAALAGTRWARKIYHSGQGTKSHLGSLVFLAATWCCTAPPMVFSGRVDWLTAAMIGAVLALLTMMAEGMADRGFDNLVVPLLSAFLLERFIPLGHGELAGRLLAALVLCGVTVIGSRWSTLDGGAILGAALLGYACAVLADWCFVFPPLALFCSHLATTRCHGLRQFFVHHLDAVLAHAVSCLPWVLLVDRGYLETHLCLIGISFSMGVHLSLLDALTRMRVSDVQRPAWFSTAKGWAIAATPGLIWLCHDWRDWALPALGVALIGMVMITLVRMSHAWFGRHLTLEKYAVGALSLGASAIGVFSITLL